MKQTREERSAYYKEWYAKNGKVRTPAQRYSSDMWKLNNIEKYYIHKQVQDAVRKGELIKPKNCEVCNREVRLSGHHDDYSKRLEVRWLCGSCHKLAHTRDGL